MPWLLDFALKKHTSCVHRQGDHWISRTPLLWTSQGEVDVFTAVGPQWRQSVHASMLAANSRSVFVFCGTNAKTRRIVAFDLHTGEERWSRKANIEFRSALLATEEVVTFVTNHPPLIQHFDAVTGTPVSRETPPAGSLFLRQDGFESCGVQWGQHWYRSNSDWLPFGGPGKFHSWIQRISGRWVGFEHLDGQRQFCIWDDPSDFPSFSTDLPQDAQVQPVMLDDDRIVLNLDERRLLRIDRSTGARTSLVAAEHPSACVNAVAHGERISVCVQGEEALERNEWLQVIDIEGRDVCPPQAANAWRLERFGDMLVSPFPSFQAFRWSES